MSASRSQICASTHKKLSGADAKAVRAVIGFDGFVDEIIEVVDKRHSATDYDRMQTIAQFGQRISAAAGDSSNYELVVTQQKLGGNGPIMANALAAIGLSTTYIGNLGYPAIHAVFQEMTKRANVISIADAAHTDALEFQDGKLMLGKHAAVKDVSWENITGRVGLEKFISLVDGAKLLGMVNWTMLPHMNNIWKHLLADVLPKVKAANRTVFVDLADPEKRTREDLRGALKILQEFQGKVNVILGLNLKEAVQVAAALDLPAFSSPESAIEQMAVIVREKLGLGAVVIHPRRGAAAANKESSAAFQGPFVESPKISTGAGDHFNAGFVTGQLLGLDLAESLCLGTATSGYYVRTAVSPSLPQLAEFIKELPAPQGA